MSEVSKRIHFLSISLVAFAIWSTQAIAQDDEELPPIEISASEGDAVTVEVTVEEEGEDSGTEEVLTEEDTQEAEIKRLRRERDLLSAQNGLRAEQLKVEFAAMREEKERLSLENGLFMEKVRAELLEQRGAIDRMKAEIEQVNNEISLAGAVARQELQENLADLKRLEEELQVKSNLAAKESSIEMERLRLAETKLKLRRVELETEFAELQAKISITEKEEEVRDRVFASQEQVYLSEPYANGVLQISDRRIALNGPIWAGISSHVSERINYFNNQSSEYPIFLVIDSSPGGSVWAGYRILKAMEGSKAPVYVVVKSYAASMAAIITAQAERSFAYPNAVILHHELSWSGVMGNLSQQKEFADDAKEWWKRLAEPVAAKMRVTLDEFRALMYEKSAVGDWQEFADVAQSIGWVDQVVDKIWETSIVKNPDRYGKQFWASAEKEELRDEKGRAYVELPRLEAFDFYFLYNPDGYYRLPQ